MRIEDYVSEYKQILSELHENGIYSDDAALTVLMERGRDRRADQISRERSSSKNEPATEKQRKFMERLGIEFDHHISRRGASKLISKAVG